MKWLNIFLLWLFYLFSITCSSSCRYIQSSKSNLFSAKVVRVADGDTIEIISTDPSAQKLNNRRIKVRLFGIDAPEIGQTFGKSAHKYAKKLLLGKEVTLNVKDTDQYGRLVAIVTLPNGLTAQEDLLKNGFVWWYHNYAPHEHKFADAQIKARRENKGLWAKQKNPIPPWQWRLNNNGV